MRTCSPRQMDKIAWYENIDGEGSYGEQQVITAEVHRHTSVHVADVDGDGDLDVLSASPGDDKIAWYENTDGKGTFGEQQVITAAANGVSLGVRGRHGWRWGPGCALGVCGTTRSPGMKTRMEKGPSATSR